MRHRHGVFLLLSLLLASCQKHEEVVAPSEPVVQAAPPAPVVVQEFLALKTQTQTWERIAPSCRQKDCAKAAASIVQFPDKSDLSVLVQKSLLQLAEAGSSARGESLEVFADNFLNKASRRHEAKLRATLLRQQGPLVAVQLDADFYTGGAHGKSATRYLNYDRHAERLLTLDDVMLDGQRPAFVQAEKEAHQAWMKGKGIDSSSQWPFKESDNFTLEAEGVLIKYNAYDIGPYSAGQPELLIPYAALKGILKPEWTLPAL
ncbi:MAG: RsiV family protein [Moraxellaceae bacterium]